MVYLWDMSDFAANPVSLVGHESDVYALAFSPDSYLLASASKDQNIRLWDTRNPKNTSVTLRGHNDTVLAVAFSPDGGLLASAGMDHTIRLWNMKLDELITIACRTAGRNLRDDEWQQYFGDKPF
jgi:WD40 repeat protein